LVGGFESWTEVEWKRPLVVPSANLKSFPLSSGVSVTQYPMVSRYFVYDRNSPYCTDTRCRSRPFHPSNTSTQPRTQSSLDFVDDEAPTLKGVTEAACLIWDWQPRPLRKVGAPQLIPSEAGDLYALATRPSRTSTQQFSQTSSSSSVLPCSSILECGSQVLVWES
jgi:hypothetical protein